MLLLAACGDPSTPTSSVSSGPPATVATSDDGMQAFAYGGLVFEVPADWVVQDVEGRLDGELACPDAPGFVFTGTPVSPDAVYTTATCDLPGEEVIVRILKGDDLAAVVEGEPKERQGDLEFVRSDGLMTFMDPPVRVFVASQDPEPVLESVVSTVRRAGPGDVELTPTTAQALTEVGDRLADRLECEGRKRVSTYSRVGSPGFVGRQAEAPLDCYVDDAGFRIIVLRYDDAVDQVIDYYRNAWLIVDRADRTVVTALDAAVARLAHERMGGELVPPPDGCCGPPTSDQLPGA